MNPGVTVPAVRPRRRLAHVRSWALPRPDGQTDEHDDRAKISEQLDAEIRPRSRIEPISAASPLHTSDPVAVPLTLASAPQDHPEKLFTHRHPAVPSTSAPVQPAARTAGASPC